MRKYSQAIALTDGPRAVELARALGHLLWMRRGGRYARRLGLRLPSERARPELEASPPKAVPGARPRITSGASQATPRT
jgi:hypothetical protein